MPAVTIPLFAQGINLRSLTVWGANATTSATVTFSGAGTDIGSSAGIGTFEAVEFDSKAILDMVKASDALWNNNLIAGYDSDIVCQELLPDNGTGALATIVQANNYGKVVACYGRLGSSSLLYVAGYGAWEDLRTGVKRGITVVQANIKPVGGALFFGTAAPTAF